MLRNEIKFFFSIKNIVCIFICVCITVLFYNKVYMNAYEQYPLELKRSMVEQKQNVTIWKSEYCKRILMGKINLEKFQEGSDEYIQLVKQLESDMVHLECWEDVENYIKKVEYYLEEPEEKLREKIYISAKKNLDFKLLSIYDEEEEIEDKELFQNSVDDWRKRMVIHEAYDKINEKEPVLTEIPTGLYVVYNALAINKSFLLLLVILIIILNYDVWSAEYELSTYRFMYMLPVSRKKMYLERLLIRGILSLLFCLLIIVELFICGCHHYGIGREQIIVFNKSQLLCGFVQKSADYVAINCEKGILYYGLQVFLILFFVLAATHMVSCLCMNQMNTLLILTLCCIVVICNSIFGSSYEIQSIPIIVGSSCIFSIICMLLTMGMLTFREI